MEKTLYIQAQAGISGDMFVAALLDLGADREVLQEVLQSLPQKGFRVEITRVKKAGIDCCDFDVLLDEGWETHDHDMAYLHGHGHEYNSACEHGDDHMHEHSHAREHGSHTHRTLAEVQAILEETAMTDGARALANRIFSILAEAEAKAHGMTKDTVHFHEVGAVDSIVDIVSAAVCLDNLGVAAVVVPYLCEGQGTVRTQHGILPIPVPAVAAIAQAWQLPLHILEARGEFVTPTGAAICAAIRTGGTLPKHFVIRKTGYGAGKRTYTIPSMLRVMLLETTENDAVPCTAVQGTGSADREDTIWKLESNVDDCSGEVLGYVGSRLFEAGARDVFFTPVYMKKNRPAWQINVLCTEERIQTLEQILFRETTTIGVRRVRMQRTILKRRAETVQTPFGAVCVKVCDLPDGERIYPEYDSVAALAEESGKPFVEIFQAAQHAAIKCDQRRTG